jgi:hypothetical protein
MDAPAKRPFGNETDLLVVVVASALAIDAPELVTSGVLADQLCGYDLITIPRIQAASDDQQKRRGIYSSRVNRSRGEQVVRFPCIRIVGRRGLERRGDRIRQTGARWAPLQA